MNNIIRHTVYVLLLLAGLTSCQTGNSPQTGLRYNYPNILDIAYTPDTLHRCYGWFTDAGSWMGFTPAETGQWINGFCGPFSLDMFSRRWMAQSAALVGFSNHDNDTFTPDSVCYFPGELYISAHADKGSISQRLNFVNANTALLQVKSQPAEPLSVTGSQWNKDVRLRIEKNAVIAQHNNGECVVLTFPPPMPT